MWKNVLKKLNDKESLVSLTLGIVVVLLTGILVFNMAKSRNSLINSNSQQEQSTNTPGVPVGENITIGKINNLPAKHTVKEGETLWNISLVYYNSGYNWVTIAKENKLVNPDVITTGQVLNIPKADPIFPEGVISTNGIQAITENTYTVKKGDSLWNISCQAYSNCYKWTEIARTNNLSSPYYIETDQKLKLPR